MRASASHLRRSIDHVTPVDRLERSCAIDYSIAMFPDVNRLSAEKVDEELKCTKIVSGWVSAPDPAKELTALPQTPSCDELGYEICELTELLGLPGCVPGLTGNNIILFVQIINNFLLLNSQTVLRK